MKKLSSRSTSKKLEIGTGINIALKNHYACKKERESAFFYQNQFLERMERHAHLAEVMI